MVGARETIKGKGGKKKCAVGYQSEKQWLYEIEKKLADAL